ncbi:iron complex transport system permease protein [Caldanaerovirga acetigignens]|uniref:Iron complex transport system permease protein n=1 Tax=Caldanaerovirga acetigignens TaxID=447595 RepID=A0A1M7GGL5_9FIRM|nr:iron ABC transporter permease [Caldanaerovirga acetigignens]SHM15433.1 iron complex transport system permease protein [Caldanaerovirga acetigignens]
MRHLAMENMQESYLRYTQRKVFIICLLFLLTILLGVYAINAGSAKASPSQVLLTLLGKTQGHLNIIIWNIRLPRVLAAITAGAGLSVAGCVMQSILRNPLASPFTLGVSQGAAFGAAVAIIALGAGSAHSASADAVIINNPYLVTISAFVGAMATTVVVLFLAQIKGVTPEAMVLAGVALSSLFSAATIILQYFASDVQVASIVFWTFGDIGRASWRDLEIMAVVTGAALIYFMANRWNYNALYGGEETAKGLGVDVEKIRMAGMFVASLVTAVTVSFLGIIGFIGLVGPHIMRRILGGDHRFLIPASSLMGGLLLLASDTLARTIISPVVLPVGAITSFMGAPLFLYLLSRGYSKR